MFGAPATVKRGGETHVIIPPPGKSYYGFICARCGVKHWFLLKCYKVDQKDREEAGRLLARACCHEPCRYETFFDRD